MYIVAYYSPADFHHTHTFTDFEMALKIYASHSRDTRACASLYTEDADFDGETFHTGLTEDELERVRAV